MTDSWEERMAAKAAKRRVVVEEKSIEESRAEWQAQQEQWIVEYAATLTPESARAEQEELDNLPPIWCACVGGPVCCRIRYEARKRVMNG